MKRVVAFLVNVGLERTVRVNITARESQIEAIDRRADEARMMRSAYILFGAVGWRPYNTISYYLISAIELAALVPERKTAKFY